MEISYDFSVEVWSHGITLRGHCNTSLFKHHQWQNNYFYDNWANSIHWGRPWWCTWKQITSKWTLSFDFINWKYYMSYTLQETEYNIMYILNFPLELMLWHGHNVTKRGDFKGRIRFWMYLYTEENSVEYIDLWNKLKEKQHNMSS